MAHRRNERNLYHSRRYPTDDEERGGHQGDRLHQRSVHMVGNNQLTSLYTGQDREIYHDSYRQSKYTDHHQRYNTPTAGKSDAIREMSHYTHEHTYNKRGHIPEREGKISRAEELRGQFFNNNKQNIVRHTESAPNLKQSERLYDFENCRYRHSVDNPENKYRRQSEGRDQSGHTQKHRERSLCPEEDIYLGTNMYKPDNRDSFEHVNYTNRNSWDTQGPGGENTLASITHYHDSVEASKKILHSRSESDRRSFHRQSVDPITSCHEEDFDYPVELRIPHGANRQPSRHCTDRERQHEGHVSAFVRKREPLIKDPPFPDNSDACRDDSCDYRGGKHVTDVLLEDMMPRKKVALLSTPSLSPGADCTQDDAWPPDIPSTEDTHTKFKSAGLLPVSTEVDYTPATACVSDNPYIEDHDTEFQTLDNLTKIKSAGLLPTPTKADYTSDIVCVSDNVYNEVHCQEFQTLANHTKVKSAGLLPTPMKTQLPQTFHHGDIRRHSSSGLLSTPVVSPDESNEDGSTDLLSAQTLSTSIIPEKKREKAYPAHSISHIKTSTACRPVDNSLQTNMVEPEREVETIIYPSRGLLRTPEGTPEHCSSSQSLKQNVYCNEDSEKILECSEQVKSVSTLSLECEIDSSCDDNMKIEANIEKPGSVLKTISQLDSSLQNDSPAPVKERPEKNKPKTNKVDSNEQFTEKQILENIQVQIQLAKALENMQKTMQTLQKKIHEGQNVPCGENAKSKVFEKVSSLREEKNDANNGRDDTNFAELGGELDDSACHSLVNKTCENYKISVPSIFKEKTEFLERLKTEIDNEKNEEGLTREELPAVEHTEQRGSNEKLATKYVNESCKQQAKKSTGRGEFKTYKEWRLAKQRMNEYFYQRNPNSEGITENGNERNQCFKEKRNHLRSPNSSSQESANETQHLDNTRNKSQVDAINFRYVGNKKSNKTCDSKNPIYDSKPVSEVERCLGDTSPSGVPSGSIREMAVPESSFEESKQTNLNSLGSAEKHKEQVEESSQKISNKTNSNQHIRHEKIEDEKSDIVLEIPRKHLGKFDSSDKTEVKHQNKVSSLGIEIKGKTENSKRDRKQNDKEDFKSYEKSKNYRDNISDKNKKHRDGHHSSDSLSKQHSREDNFRHLQDRSKSEGHHLDRFGKCKISRTSKSHRHHQHNHQHHHHEKLLPSSREKDRSLTCREKNGSSSLIGKEKNLSDFITNTCERGRESFDTFKTNENEGKNKQVWIRKEIQIEQSQTTYHEHKYDINEKGNLFENMALNNEIIDIVGGLSTDEESNKILTNFEPGIDVSKRNLKASFVKLFDFSQSKEKIKTNLHAVEKAKQNSIKKTIERISSLKDNECITNEKRSKCQKDAFQSDSLSKAQSVKSSLVESEDSSTEVDPFEKINNFLCKDKKKTSVILTDSEVQSPTFRMKPAKRLDDFVVPDSHVSDLENSNSSLNIDTDRSPQNFKYCGEKKGKTFVKHLKRVNDTLFWKKNKILFPRIKLRRLNRTDIKKLKLKLRENKLDTGLQMKGQPVNSNKNASEGLKNKKNDENIARLNPKRSAETEIVGSLVKGRIKENKTNQDKRFKMKESYVPLNKCEHVEQDTARGSKSLNKSLSDSTKTSSNNESKLVSSAPVSDEANLPYLYNNFRRYKRIMPVPCSSTEHSESSDIERIVYVSHRQKLEPVISDSDQSEVFEGSLGSEDSTCLDLIDESDVDESEGTKDRNTLRLVKSEFQVMNAYQSTEGKHDTETSLFDKDNLLISLEIEIKTNELLSEEKIREEKKSDTCLSPVSKQKIRRNIFTDLSNECSTTSETESISSVSLEQIKFKSANEQTPLRNSLALAKVTASLGKTLKTLKVENRHALSSEESGGPEFVCLPERKAVFKRLNLNETVQSESSVSVDYSLDEAHEIENSEFLSGQQTREECKNPERKLEKAKTDNDKRTCSESASESVKRSKFDSSSTDSSDDEHVFKSLSARKYTKRQSEEKQDTKVENKEKQKGSGSKYSESRKQLPFKAKRLFKSATQTKKQATIMQMDGNADLVLGPPDESSGEEGDVEDNVACINVDSDNEDGSQDLLASVPERPKMNQTQNLKRLFEQISPRFSVKEEMQDLGDSIDSKEAVTMKGVTDKDNSAYAVDKDRENDVSIIEIEKSDDDDDDDKKQDIVKNEPDWLKFGYTQELETIFLSDDDEMVMSVSQPVILVSDEETQDPDATQDLILENIKQEKDDIENDGTIDATYENYSSAEDWSDRGSDFEPENIFNSLQKANTNYASAAGSDHNLSECSLFSDDDLSDKSQSLFEPKSTCTKNDGFESSDGAVLSVNEDELLGSPQSDETTSVSNLNDDDLLEITEVKRKVWQETDVSITEKENTENKDFSSSSDSDEILCSSVLEVENRLRKESTLKAEHVSDFEKDKDMIESSQRFDPIIQKNESSLMSKSVKCKAKKQKSTSARQLQENGHTDKEYEALYLQDTQVDQDVSEDTSNSLTAFDFFSEYFLESDADSKLIAGSETGKSSSKLCSGKKYEYETLSDDSDIMILDNHTKNEKIKAHSFLDEELCGSKRKFAQAQPRDGMSESKGPVQDKYFCQTQAEFTQLEKTMPDIYFTATQIEKSAKSSFVKQIQVKTSEPRSYDTHTQAKTPEPDVYDIPTQKDTGVSAYEKETQVDNVDSSVFDLQTQMDEQVTGSASEQTDEDSSKFSYFEQTQVDRPGINISLKKDTDEADHSDMSDDPVSYEDPQLQDYYQNAPFNKNVSKGKRFIRNLGIIFDSFSHSSEEDSRNEYDILTQVDTVTPKHNESMERKSNYAKHINAKITKSIKSVDSSVYNVFTEAVSSAESEGDEYGALTQVDPATRRKTIDVVGKTEQPLMPQDGSAYVAATQFESISEPESEIVIQNGELYDIDTQVDRNYTKGTFSGVKSMSEMSDNDENNSYIVRLKNSVAGQKKTYYLAERTHQKRSDIASTSHFHKGKKDIYDFSDSSSNIDSSGDLHAKEDDSPAAVQNNFDDVFDSERNDKKEDFYYIATQIDINNVENENFIKPIDSDDENNVNKTSGKKHDNSDNEFYDETVEGELPDIEPVSTDINDIYMPAMQNYTKDNDSSRKESLHSERKSSITEKTKQTSVQGAKSILKRPISETLNDNTVRFGQISESSTPKKPRVFEKKILEIKPQKLKTVAEKRASGTVSVSSNPQISLNSVNTTSSTSDIEIIDASKSSLWLSKNVISKKKVWSKVRETDKFGKRKRRESAGEELRARMMAARSQMKERSMHTITHPDAVKRQKTGPAATVTMLEVEDVTLPTNSQIIQQGLPLLNSTGILLKRNTTVPHTSENHPSEEVDPQESLLELASSHVTTVSSATTTISVASSASLLNTVMSSSACVTSAELQKEQKEIRDSNGNGATGIVRVEERRDKTKPEKEKTSHKREGRDKERNHHSSSGKGRSKENYDKRAKENSESVKTRTKNKDKCTNKDNIKNSCKISKEDKDKNSKNESKESNRKSDEGRNYKEDKMSAKDRSGKKTEKEKHRSKDTKQRHESGYKDINSNDKGTKQRHESGQKDKNSHSKDTRQRHESGQNNNNSNSKGTRQRHESGQNNNNSNSKDTRQRHESGQNNNNSNSKDTRQRHESGQNNNNSNSKDTRQRHESGQNNNNSNSKDTRQRHESGQNNNNSNSKDTRQRHESGQNNNSNSKDTRQRCESGQNNKTSNSKDTRHRRESEQSRERERHSSARSVPSETQIREKDPKETSDIKNNIQKLSNITSTKTTSSSTVLWSSALVTSSVTTSGEVSAHASLVNAWHSAHKVKKTVSITSTIATTTATVTSSRSTTMSSSVLKTTTSTHIQSSVLLQKHHGSSAPYSVPVASTSGRQPFQPIVYNIPASTEPMPSNMVGNVQTLQWTDFLKVILKWSPNWFEERGKMEHGSKRAPPPDVTQDLFGLSNHTLFPLLERYENYKEYSEKFMLPLLLHETWESCYSTWRERKGKQRLCQHKLMFYGQNQGGEYTFIGLISERDRLSSNYASEGDLVKVTINVDMKVSGDRQENIDYPMSGFIDRVTFRDFSVERICAHYKDMAELRKQLGDCVSIKLVVKVRPRNFIANEKKIVNLVSICNLVNTLRQFNALSSLPSSPLCRDLLYPTGNLTYCDTAPSNVPGLQDKYNQSQLRAISTAGKIASLPQHYARVCLLQGPPGTGKSHTIVGIIKHLVKISGGRCRICLCAPSNAAVDELLVRLIKHNRTEKNLPIHIVRLGKKNSVRVEVQPYCLNSLIQKNVHLARREEMLKQLPQSLQGERMALENKISMVTKNMENASDQFQRLKLRKDLMILQKQKDVLESKYDMPKTKVDPREERKAKSSILLKAHVIAGTLSSIGSNALQAEFQAKSGLSFQVVIVDEATQAIELETLIPLQYGVTKLILVGDPEQLPATVLSQVAIENKFNMSLFERLDSHFRYKAVNPVILLDTQYRMDPEISAFPNKYIYNGRIKDDRCVIERSQSPLAPYLLFDVSEGIELFSQGTRSMSNPLEAIFTAELCKFIVTESPVKERVIGIIAPYANQKSEIFNELQKRGLNEIEVSTVDGFQGREKHVIVMSCVRANASGTVGFVGNRNRMNVSLTRAKYAMYLVGHFEALQASDEWKALLADAKQRHKIVPVSKTSMKQAIRKVLKEQKRDTNK